MGEETKVRHVGSRNEERGNTSGEIHSNTSHRGSSGAIDQQTKKSCKRKINFDEPEQGPEVMVEKTEVDLTVDKTCSDQESVFRGRADSFIARMHLVQECEVPGSSEKDLAMYKESVVDQIEVDDIVSSQNSADTPTRSIQSSIVHTTNEEQKDRSKATVLVSFSSELSSFPVPLLPLFQSSTFTWGGTLGSLTEFMPIFAAPTVISNQELGIQKTSWSIVSSYDEMKV